MFLSELASALGSETEDDSCDTSESIRAYLQRYPESNLSNLLSGEKQQEKLRLIASDILQMFLDSQLYKCELTKSFLREILSGSVLESTIASCSKPEYINGWIVYLLEQGEPELISALDAGFEQARKNQTATASTRVDPAETELKDTIMRANVGSRESNHKTNHVEIAVDETTTQVKLPNDVVAAEDMRRRSENNPFPIGKVGDGAETGSSGASETITTPTSSNSEKAARTERMPSLGCPNMDDPIACTSRDGGAFTGAASTAGDAVQSPTLGNNRPPPPPSPPPSHTLRNAEVSLIDDFNSLGEDTIFRSRPTKEYLLQIEPTSSRHQGWMVARQYTDFEALHEILRRISLISGASSFASQYAALPTWKGQSRDVLRRDLELYLREALRHNPLADSQGMSTFLDKTRESGNSSTTGSKTPGFTFPNQAAFETMGKGMLGALANAPKGVTGGGKAVIDGVTGVFGVAKTGNEKSIEQNKASQRQSVAETLSSENPPQSKSREALYQTNNNSLDTRTETDRMEETRTFAAETHIPTVHSDNDLIYPSQTIGIENHGQASSWESHLADSTAERGADLDMTTRRSRSLSVASDYVQAQMTPSEPFDNEEGIEDSAVVSRESEANHEHVLLSEDEAMMTVELLFAVLNETYSLSSVWKIRKALLNAAKSFLLRPGNPNLEYTRGLIQKSISENTSDEALAGYITRLIETCVVTADGTYPEYHELSDDEKERLRVKARQLFIDRGIPPALASVMGTSATGEALGRVFDSIQIQPITRGLVFAITLQALKVVLQ